MRKRLGSVWPAVLLLLAGIALCAYPHISRALHSLRTAAQARVYQADRTAPREDVAQVDADPRLEQLYSDMVAHNRILYEQGQAELSDPFAYEQAGFDLEAYGYAEDLFGYLLIEKLRLAEPIYLGASAENMNKGIAHLTQTSLPIGGVNTNAVLAGHRDMASKPMFRSIEKLEAGDRVELSNFRETLVYRVESIKIIDPSDINEILIQPNRDMLTLLSCNPRGYNYQRIVVYCARSTEPSFGIYKKSREEARDGKPGERL